MAGRQPSPRAVCCARCGAANVIKDWHCVPEEFSAKCPRCERRAIYRAAELKPIDGPAAPDAPRRGAAMFGGKRSA